MGRPVRGKVDAWKVLSKDVQRKLVCDLVKPIYTAFRGYYDLAMEAPEDTEDFFLSLIEEMVSDWNDDDKDAETQTIIEKVPKLEKYLKTYIISNVMIIATIRLGESPDSIDVEVPNLNDYVFSIMKSVGNSALANPNLFNPNGSKIEIHSRKLEALGIIRDAIAENTKDVLPTEKMITDYIEDIKEEGESDSDSETEADPAEKEDTEEVVIESNDVVVAEDNSATAEQSQGGNPEAETKKISISKANWENQDTPQKNTNPEDTLMEGLDDTEFDQ